jgi:hypothetical protein
VGKFSDVGGINDLLSEFGVGSGEGFVFFFKGGFLFS